MKSSSPRVRYSEPWGLIQTNSILLDEFPSRKVCMGNEMACRAP